MKKLGLLIGLTLLLGSAALPAKAAIVSNLGLDPTSATGNFSNSVGGTTFTDFYTFQLNNLFNVTIASATNVFPQPSDFISGFTGEVFQQLGATPNPATDTLVLGPATAGPCAQTPTICQVLSGSATLGPGNYYLDIFGTGSGTSGYGGNLATFAVNPVPLPPALQMFLGGLLLFGGFAYASRRRKGTSSMMAAA